MPSTLDPSVPAQSPDGSVRVAVVEDDTACRFSFMQALESAPDMRLAWGAATQAHALLLLPTEPLDVLLVDLGLPDGSGLDVIAAARGFWPYCAPMVCTIFGDEGHVLAAIEAGAMGYLLKDAVADAVVQEVRSLHAGGSPISPLVARKLLLRAQAEVSAPAPVANAASLSVRELEVLRLVARGHTLAEVAQALGVTLHTTRTFVRRIYAKLQVSSRVDAINKATQQGLLDAP